VAGTTEGRRDCYRRKGPVSALEGRPDCAGGTHVLSTPNCYPFTNPKRYEWTNAPLIVHTSKYTHALMVGTRLEKAEGKSELRLTG
jgi:hypothetical protein